MNGLLFMILFVGAKALFSGDGTTYGDANGGGTCGFGQEWATGIMDGYYMNVAINALQWNSGFNCGRCVSIRYNNNKNVIALVNNLCPECKHGDLDMNTNVWNSVTNGMNPNRISITWDFVKCPLNFVKGKSIFKIKDGSNQYWIAFNPQNQRATIISVYLQRYGEKTARRLTRDDNTLKGFYFVHSHGPLEKYRLLTVFSNKRYLLSKWITAFNGFIYSE